MGLRVQGDPPHMSGVHVTGACWPECLFCPAGSPPAGYPEFLACSHFTSVHRVSTLVTFSNALLAKASHMAGVQVEGNYTVNEGGVVTEEHYYKALPSPTLSAP